MQRLVGPVLFAKQAPFRVKWGMAAKHTSKAFAPRTGVGGYVVLVALVPVSDTAADVMVLYAFDSNVTVRHGLLAEAVVEGLKVDHTTHEIRHVLGVDITLGCTHPPAAKIRRSRLIDALSDFNKQVAGSIDLRFFAYIITRTRSEYGVGCVTCRTHA